MIRGQPPACASVGPCGKRRANHSRTAGWKRSRSAAEPAFRAGEGEVTATDSDHSRCARRPLGGHAARRGPAPGAHRLAAMDKGVMAAQQLRDAVSSGWLRAGEWRIPPEAVQPASVDLRLGEHAWALRCSFLPDSESTVEEKVAGLAFERIDLRDGATLERDRPYLVPLIERLSLPPQVRARANPKSSTGRLDVFTRVLTDRSHRFDEIAPGYEGALYLEVVPRTFAIRVRTGLALNQVRLIRGDARLADPELLALHHDSPLLFYDEEPVAESELSIADGLFLSLDARGPSDATVGYRAKKNSLPIDLARGASLRWQEYWEPVHPEPGGRIVLEPEVFYLLLSAEGVSVPPCYAAEMLAYDPTAGEP